MRNRKERGAVTALPILIVALLAIFVNFTAAQQDATCNALEPCKVGCCSKFGKCGFGDDFCKDGCQGTCTATAECGKNAKPDAYDCPLNVCCSKHGFCGYDPLYCNDECQNKDKSQCSPVSRPKCGENSDAMAAEVRIAYYGAWSAERSCDSMQPESIPAGVLTHINVAFEFVSAEHEITDEVGHISGRVSRLKNIYPGLRVNIALGGWVFNDPPTETRFSDMASSVPNRKKFIESLISYMQRYSLDGVDLDWEYPVATDRGGVPGDYGHFVLLCAEIREAFDSYDPGWQLTITLPASLWYLKHFDIIRLEKYVDWFNVMTYDIHGIWDQHNIWTGPFLKGHTNITEIEDGLDLLWRNGINSKKVVMGFGFYGRGFTMTDTSCTKPPSCTFSGPGFPGDCTNEPGILSYNEVLSMKGELSAKVEYDDVSSVKWMTYGSNQWISFDDAESFKKKKEYMFSRCLKGFMIWELGLDTANNDALVSLFGEEAVAEGKRDTSLNPDERNKLAFDLSAYTGQNCYIAEGCTDGIKESGNGDASCKAGYSSVETGNSLLSVNAAAGFIRPCDKGTYHNVCCPTKAMPKNCEWIGAPERSAFGCNGKCGASQFELVQDGCIDQKCSGKCGSGQRSLCCDSTEILQKCYWSDCGWNENGLQGLCDTGEVTVAKRFDKASKEKCGSSQVEHRDGSVEIVPQYRDYCCKEKEAYEDCHWSDSPGYFEGRWDSSTWPCVDQMDCRPFGVCNNQACFEGSVAMTRAGYPEPLFDQEERGELACWLQSAAQYVDYALCCSPPSRFTKDWPVNPLYLWSEDIAHWNSDDDITWEWANNFGNNHDDKTPNNLEEDPGADPYGFIMLDGPPGSIANQFPKQFTFVTAAEPTGVVPRSFITTNQTILDATFDHVEETFLVYCHHPHDSVHCREIFHKGAVDTIIRLPHHIGEGPFARVVSMDPVNEPPSLPAWALKKRNAAGVDGNGIYKLKFDYNFHAIKRAEDTVNMRVDYTNLKNYWDDVTDQPKKKRSASDSMDFSSWKSRVDRAKNASYTSGHDEFDVAVQGKTDLSPKSSVPPPHHQHERRWFGSFVNWLAKITTITKEETGSLPMSLSKVFNIYSGRLRCVNPSGVQITAGLDITADVRLEMGARYAYYFSGTVVPPKVIDTYIFLGAQPSIYAGINIRGNAELSYESERKKLITTITYPGLSVKGIATVGPSLDLHGQLYGRVTVSGQMKVGAKYTMDPIEMYMPNDDQTHQRASSKVEKFDTDSVGLKPVFQAGVRATVGLELRITPEINCGIKIGGDTGLSKKPLVQAQVAVYVNTTVAFDAWVTAATDGQSSNWEYGYKVELRWRIGMDAVAELYLYGSWKSDEFEAVPWQTIPIYGPIVVKSAPTAGSKLIRGLDSPPVWELPDAALPNPVFGRLSFHSLYEPSKLEPWSMMGNMSNNTDVAPLLRRADAKGENEFMLGDFKCTTGNSPCDAGLSNSAFEKRHYDERGIYKRATADCRIRIPRLYYNCVGGFADQAVQGANGVVNIPGICSSVRKYLTNRGIVTNQQTLTWDQHYDFKRRPQSCASARSPCFGPNGDDARYKTALGGLFPGVGTLVSCDEFPFASSEEGGYGWVQDPASLFPPNRIGTTRTCVPEWQQTLQGNCNKLLSSIVTNVEYFNNAQQPNDGSADGIDAWSSWSEKGWNTAGSFTQKRNPGRQRLTTYDDDQPYLYGGAQGGDKKLGWFHKRNFTLFLVNNGLGGTSSFPGNDFQSGEIIGSNSNKPTTDVVGDAAWIMCAISLRGQARYKFTGQINGYCWDGQTKKKIWKAAHDTANGVVYEVNQYYGCAVDFVGAAFSNGKRSLPIGHFHDEPIYGVKRVEDAPIIEVEVPLHEAVLPHIRDSFPLDN